MLAKQGLEDTAKRVEALGRKVSLHLTDVSVRAQMEALPEEVVARSILRREDPT